MIGADSCGVLAAVHIASALVGGACVGAAAPASCDSFDFAFLERHGYIEELPAWQSVAEE